MRPRRQSAEFRESSKAAVSHLWCPPIWIDLAGISTILHHTSVRLLRRHQHADPRPEDTP